MTFTDRQYQTDFIAEIRNAFAKGGRRICAVAPTGSGKTHCFAIIVQGAAKKGSRIVIMAHRQELIRQICGALTEMGVHHGLITAKASMNQLVPVQVASVQTLVKRLDKIIPPDLLVVDEFHHSAAGSYLKILAAWPNAKVIGMTATPERLDGRGLGQVADSLVIGPEMQWLINEGYLARPRYLSIPLAGWTDEGKELRAGDFKSEDTDVFDTPKIIGDIVAHYRKYADGLPTIAFCKSVVHAEHIAASMRDAGYRSESIDGKMADDVRQSRLKGLESGAIQVLTTCDLVSEGFDLPLVSCGIFARPTASLGMYMQQAGRILRPMYAPGYDQSTRQGRLDAQLAGGKPRAICLDHVGNVRRHGLLEMPREWSLEGASKRKAGKQEDKFTVRQCPNCYAVHAPAFECPECGHMYRSDMNLPETADGELVELGERDAEFMRCVQCGKIHAIAQSVCPNCGLDADEVNRKQKRQEVGMTKGLADLIKIGQQRNYKNPRFWATQVLMAREKKKQKVAA